MKLVFRSRALRDVIRNHLHREQARVSTSHRRDHDQVQRARVSPPVRIEQLRMLALVVIVIDINGVELFPECIQNVRVLLQERFLAKRPARNVRLHALHRLDEFGRVLRFARRFSRVRPRRRLDFSVSHHLRIIHRVRRALLSQNRIQVFVRGRPLRRRARHRRLFLARLLRARARRELGVQPRAFSVTLRRFLAFTPFHAHALFPFLGAFRRVSSRVSPSSNLRRLGARRLCAFHRLFARPSPRHALRQLRHLDRRAQHLFIRISSRRPIGDAFPPRALQREDAQRRRRNRRRARRGD
mmetsp:Transcript_5258/g.20470  ORF Transcript_5258/g.20470 Transcript_5258/m.20470 type:complete len:299 (+) Transcript_5258:3503-4399(+)